MSRRRPLLRLVAGLVVPAVALAGSITAPAAAGHAPRSPDRIELPNGFQPEGIDIHRGTAYLGSLADGDIYAADLRSGRGRVISQGPGTPSVGLKTDGAGRLYISGGPAGAGRVVDIRSGAITKTYQFTTGASFVNDVTLTPKAAWFTDSQQPQLYRVGRDRHGKPAGSATTVPLSGDYQHVPGFNANGIASTPDGRALIIVQSATATLFRVDPDTGVSTRIDLGGASVPNGDGLLLEGNRLYVVQNQLNRIGIVDLNDAGTSGRLVAAISSPDFAVPTTVAASGDRLYLPNARFGTPPTPDTPYWVSSVPAKFPNRIELPNGWLPEGIDIRHSTAYFGSRADGDIFAADLRSGKGRVISQGPGTPSIGLKADDRGRLFVAGGNAGTGRVVDIGSGAIVKTYQFTTATSFVNDVVLTPDAAWFTDSRQPQLYRVGIGKHGELAAAAQTLPLTGDYQHVPDVNNANGIVRTPDGRGLIIVQSSTGFLFKVDTRTGHTTKIDLGTAEMTNGDGLLLLGTTLYVVQNRLNKIAELRLNGSATAATLLRELTSSDFDVPTTAAAFGNRLYLPNARFTTTPTPTTPYWATAVNR